MAALPGMHYCEKHQGNSAHYAVHNCDLCRALFSPLPEACVALWQEISAARHIRRITDAEIAFCDYVSARSRARAG